MAAIREATEIEEQILDNVARRLPQTKGNVKGIGGKNGSHPKG
jgi:hypothetical protein